MAKPSETYAGQPLMIAAFKEAVGMDTHDGAFWMHLRHVDNEFKQPRRRDVLTAAWLMMAIAVSLTGCVAVLNR